LRSQRVDPQGAVPARHNAVLGRRSRQRREARRVAPTAMRRIDYSETRRRGDGKIAEVQPHRDVGPVRRIEARLVRCPPGPERHREEIEPHDSTIRGEYKRGISTRSHVATPTAARRPQPPLVWPSPKPHGPGV
jgi:hypothetical protein